MHENRKTETSIYGLYIGNISILIENKIVKNVILDSKKDITTKRDDLTTKIHDQIIEYLKGERMCFEVEFEIEGTPFQRLVLENIYKIPYGETRTYRQVAEAIGKPKAYRAVGNACNSNKIPLIIPCHRVVRSNGDIGGYVGGCELKRALLEMERRYKIN